MRILKYPTLINVKRKNGVLFIEDFPFLFLLVKVLF